MSKKSLDQIWEKIQKEKALEEKRRFERERQIWEQKELARKEYLKTLRLYEKIGPNTPTSSSSSAGGKQNPTPTPDPTPDKVFGKHYVLAWEDSDTGTWRIVVHNYENGETSDIIETNLSFNEWDIFTLELSVSEYGHCVVYSNDLTSKYKILFISSNGVLIDTKDLDTNEDFQYTPNTIILLGELNGISTCYHFTGTDVWTHTFPDVGIADVEVDDGSEGDVTKDGSFIIEAPNNSKYFIGRPNGDLIEITELMSGQDNYRLSYNSDFIFKLDNNNDISIISQEGDLVNSFDLSPYGTTGIIELALYGDNCAFAHLSTSYDYQIIISYDWDLNAFLSMTVSDSMTQYYAPSLNWGYLRPSYGKTLNFYKYDSVPNSSWFNTTVNLEYFWIPKGSTQILSHDFGSTVSFIDGIEMYTSDRSYSVGENPIVLFAYEGGPIQVGFLGSDGFLTQSTGIQFASCSNVLGGNIGEYSFALFDVGSDRIWQIYGTNSIIDQTNTSQYWEWGSNGNVNRNGTLVVFDSDVTSNSFLWTPESGIEPLSNNPGLIINDAEFGNRTGLSDEYQVFLEYDSSIFVRGFYLISRSGKSEFVDCFPGLSPSNWVLNGRLLSSDLLTLNFYEDVTTNTRVQNYKIPTLELIDDFNPGDQSYGVNTYNNRCLIVKENGGSYDVRFVGPNGVDTFNIIGDYYTSESNDPYDND